MDEHGWSYFDLKDAIIDLTTVPEGSDLWRQAFSYSLRTLIRLAREEPDRTTPRFKLIAAVAGAVRREPLGDGKDLLRNAATALVVPETTSRQLENLVEQLYAFAGKDPRVRSGWDLANVIHADQRAISFGETGTYADRREEEEVEIPRGVGLEELIDQDDSAFETAADDQTLPPDIDFATDIYNDVLNMLGPPPASAGTRPGPAYDPVGPGTAS